MLNVGKIDEGFVLDHIPAGMSLDIPVIIGAAHATEILKGGAVVTIDGKKGTVSANDANDLH